MVESHLRAHDFRSFRVSVQMRNQTSKAVALEPVRSIYEWKERGFLLELPPRSCATGHHFEGQFHFEPSNGEPFVFEFTARVVSSINQEDCVAAELEFLQFSEVLWAQVLADFDARQAEIMHFIRLARGV